MTADRGSREAQLLEAVPDAPGLAPLWAMVGVAFVCLLIGVWL